MLLDQGVFKEQGLVLAGDDDRFDGPGVADKGGGFDVLAAGKVRAEAVPQRFCLADVDDLPVLVLPQVYARQSGGVMGGSPEIFQATGVLAVHLKPFLADNRVGL